MCGTNASFSFKHDKQMQSSDKNVAIGGAEVYMPLCRECFNEKTKQQNLLNEQLNKSIACAQVVKKDSSMSS